MEKYLREVALRSITYGEVIRPVVLPLQIYIRAPHERGIATAVRMSTCKDTLLLISECTLTVTRQINKKNTNKQQQRRG